MEPVWNILVWVVLPLWVVAGFLDYLCHRASHIEKANGARESLIHWLMLAEVGVPLGLAVFFRINALLLALMLICLIAHEVTGYLDLKLAMATRKVTIFEHQVHSALEILPLTAILLVMILHWPQTQALFGFGTDKAQWFLGPKQAPRWGEIVPPAAGFLFLALLPYGEEFVRGFRKHSPQAQIGTKMFLPAFQPSKTLLRNQSQIRDDITADQPCIDTDLLKRAEETVSRLRARKLSIVTAESCTAGLVAAVLSRAEGTGEVFDGSFVAYSKAHKTRALGVNAEMLRRGGAVNAATAEQMLAGALTHSPADVGVAITGVLGPKPDEDGNPVGLVFLTVGLRDAVMQTVRRDYGRQPHEILRRRVVLDALAMLDGLI